MPDRLLWPVQGESKITNPYGAGQYRAPGFKGNLPATNVGLDIGAPEGSPMVAAADGTVLEAGWSDAGWGNTVLIRTADGHTVRQSHMKDAPLVKAGQKVTMGQRVGLVGKTGNTDGGSHADLELRDPSGKNIDPTPLLTRNANMPTKSNKVTTLESQVAEARREYERLNSERARVLASDDPDENPNDRAARKSSAEYLEWSTGQVGEVNTAGMPSGSKPSPRVKAWQDAKAKLEGLEQKLSGAVDEDAEEAAKNAPSTTPKVELRSGPNGSTQAVIIHPDGQITTREVIASQPSEDGAGQVVNLGLEGGVLLVGKDGSVKTLVSGKGEDESAVEQRRAQTRNYNATAAATELSNSIKQQEAEAWKPVQALIDAGADPAEVKRAVGAAVNSVQEYASLQGIEQQQNLQRINTWKQLEDSSGTRHDPDTLEPIMGLDGKTPLLTEDAQSKRDTLEAQKGRDTETARANTARESGDAAQLDATLRGQALTSSQAAGEAAQRGAEAKLARTVGPGYHRALQEILTAFSEKRRPNFANVGPMAFTVAPEDEPANVGARARDELYKKLAPSSPAARAALLAQGQQSQAQPAAAPPSALPPAPPIDYSAAEAGLQARAAQGAPSGIGLPLAYQNLSAPPEDEARRERFGFPPAYAA